MFNYTVELRCIKDVFDFDYDFYEEQFRCDFEEKFIDHYYFDEIGFETIERFKQRLKAKLNKKMPYWAQLYETELEAEGIAFLLNKDLKESFIRTVDTEDKILGTSTIDGNKNANSNGSNSLTTSSSLTEDNKSNGTDNLKKSASGTENGKVSNIADGVASAGLDAGLLTGVSENKTNTTGTDERTVSGTETSTKEGSETSEGTRTDSSSETSSQNGKNTEDRNGKLLEKTELVSQGNIGTTSSAELLDKWRSVLINIDELIIDECQDLFMGIF